VVAAPKSASFARTPYAEPFVNLSTRAFVPVSSDLKLSAEIWKLNIEFYQSLDKTFCLKGEDGVADRA
jgi:hypothetical protein